jgi:dihydrofolate synthase/folylpolyglutamate synthase
MTESPFKSPFVQQLMSRRRFGVKPGLDTIRAVLAELGNPERGLRFVHVAGTNGKGAVCAMLDSILRAAGLRVCRYTSPHLVSVAERFFVDGAPAEYEALSAAAAEVFPVVERLEREKGVEATFFECLTAVAFTLFAKVRPDVVVMEAGLGGRLDATNVIAPENLLVAAITRIGLDHCDWLGSTHAAIAEEKAGIVKRGRPVVAGAMPAVARETVALAAERAEAPFISAECCSVAAGPGGDWSRPAFATPRRRLPPAVISLVGPFQVENALTSLAVVDALEEHAGLSVPDAAVVKGLETAVWPGRAQRVVSEGVEFVVDGAHNPDGATALREALSVGALARKDSAPVALLCGFCGDKDVLAHLRIMSAAATTGWAVPIQNVRSLDPVEVVDRMELAGFSSSRACADLAEGLAFAKAWARGTGGRVVVCGSLFLAGEALVALGAYPWNLGGPDANEIMAH